MKKSRFISLLLCVCMVMSLFVGLTESARADDVIDYVVVNNDYLFKICQRHGLNYYQVKGAIMALNGFTSEQQLNRLSVGQHIKLPASNAIAATVKSTTSTTVSTSTTVGGTTTTTSTTSTLSGNLSGYTVAYYLAPVVVKSGDTLNSICNSLDTSYYNYANVILRVNGLKGANSLQAGQTIYIPTTKPFTSGNGYAVVAHSVASGENLTKICSQYNLNYQAATTKALVDGLNPNKNLNKIYSGDVLYIPVATSAVTTVVSTGSGSSGGSSASTLPVETGYQISITAANNGNPYAVVGSRQYATRAEAGTSVVIQTNPNSGYAVKSIKVVRTDNNSNVVLMNNAFTMPESNVQITIAYEKGLKISKATSAYGSFDTLVYGYATNSAFYGDEVVVKPLPYSGYSVNDVYFVKTSDTSVKTTVQPDKSGVYKFNMPNYDITVYVDFIVTTYHKLSAHVIGKGSVVFTVDGKTVTEAKKGTTVIATIKPQDDTWFYDDAANTPTISDSSVTLTKIGEKQYKFVVGDNDITLYGVTFENVQGYKLKVEHANEVAYKGYITFTVRDSKTGNIRVRTDWAKKGDIVDIVYWPNNGYVAVPNITGTDNDTADFTVLAPTGVLLSTWTDRGNQFVMPDSDVNVRWPVFKESSSTTYYSVNFTKISGAVKETFATTETTWPGTGSPTRTGKQPGGTDIYVVVTPMANSSIKSVKVNNGAVTVTDVTSTYGAPAGSFVYKFTTPTSGDSNIEVELKEALQTVKVSAIGDGGIDDSSRAYQKVVLTINGQYVDYVDGSGSLTPANVVIGSNIRIWFNLMNGYKVKQVEKTGGSGDKIIFPDSNGAYMYTVTEADYKSGKPIVFKVTTEAQTEKQYYVLHSTPDTTFGTYDINVKDKATGAVTKYTSQDAVAHAGDTIQIGVNVKTGYDLDQIIKDSIVVSGADIKKESSPYDYLYTFIMPSNNVKTDVIFKAVPNVFSIKTYSGSVTWKENPASAAAGEVVSVKVKPSTDGQIIDASCVSIDPSTVLFSVTSVPNEEGYYTLTFTMPKADISEIKVTPRTPTVTGGTPLPKQFGWTSSTMSCLVGSTVKFEFNITASTPPEPDYEVKSISGLGDVPYVINYDASTYKGSVEFIMPAYDVVLVATTDYVEHG